MMESDSTRSGSPDWILLGATAALIALGMMMVYSSTFDLGYRLHDDATYFLKRQSMWLAIGAVGMLVASLLPYRYLTKVSIPIMAVSLLLLLILVVSPDKERLLIGQSVSPVELAKLAVVIYIGHWLSSKGDALRQLPYGLLPFTIMVGVIAGLVIAQPDISEALVIVLVAVIMFFLAGADIIQLVIGIGGGIAAFGFVISQFPFAIERIQPFVAEWKDPLTSSNFQLRQGIIALGSGGLFGLGPGNGRMKYRWLPAAHTDSIFGIVGEELGLLGCLAFIALFALVVYRGLRIAQEAPDLFGGLLASGITCWIGLQAMINLGVVTGTIPFTGIALPFTSLGGSSLVTSMVGIGIMLSISRTIQADHSSHEARRMAQPGTKYRTLSTGR